MTAGSSGVISGNRLTSTRLSAIAPAAPIPRPIEPSRTPRFNTSARMVPRSAPNAIRKPISWVRCRTAKAITA